MSTEDRAFQGAAFMAFDYLSVRVPSEHEPLYRDCYENLGWKAIESRNEPVPGGWYHLSFKRNRQIAGRSQLFTLQKKCEGVFQMIDSLERRKATLAMSLALLVGLVGTAFMAVSVFSYLSQIIALTIAAGFLGFVGWALAPLFYQRTRAIKTAEVTPKIEEQYDQLCQIGEQARALWA